VEKIAQNAGQHMLLSKLIHKFSREKISPTVRASYLILKRIASSKQSPKWRKFAPSGHPAWLPSLKINADLFSNRFPSLIRVISKSN
jgi:hypothetical protein